MKQQNTTSRFLMENLKFLKSFVLIYFSLFPFESFAGVDCDDCEWPGSLQCLSKFSHTLEESICALAMRNKPEQCKNLKKIAHYRDRDNSMVPARSRVGRAMGVKLSLNGLVQSIQVCPV